MQVKANVKVKLEPAKQATELAKQVVQQVYASNNNKESNQNRSGWWQQQVTIMN